MNTERAYAGRIALYLSYCADRGVDWAAPSAGQLSAFLNWLVDERKFRSKGTANAITGTLPVPAVLLVSRRQPGVPGRCGPAV